MIPGDRKRLAAQKGVLLDEIGRRLDQHMDHEPLFTLRWELA